MKRMLFKLFTLCLASTSLQAQYLMIDQSMHRTSASPGGAILRAPVLTTDQEFWFPATGGTLVTEASLSGWNLSGNTLTGTEVLGSTNGFDVHLVAGGSSNVRLTLLNSEAGVLLPAQTELRLGDVSGGEYSALKSPSTLPSNVTYILPDVLPDSARQRVQVADVTGSVVTLGYTTPEKSSDVSFDLKYDATETNAGPIDVLDMEIAVEANKTYAFEALISVQYPNGALTTNAEISFDIPAGADLHYYRVDLTDNNAAARGNKTQATETYDAPEEPGENHYLLHGFVRTNGTSGTVQMRLATSTAGRTIRLTQNSYMKIVTN